MKLVLWTVMAAVGATWFVAALLAWALFFLMAALMLIIDWIDT